MRQLQVLLLTTSSLICGSLTAVAADGGAADGGAADGGAADDGFVSLFNGKDLSGWVVMGKKEGWQVIDGGVLRSEGGKGGNWLRSQRKYGDFILKVDWRVSKGGNSGVFIRSAEKGAPWTTGYEVQISNAPRDNAHCTGSLYGYFPVKPRPDETHDKWHTFEIHCRGSRLKVVADGVTCVDVDQSADDKTKNKPLAGYVGLQDSHSPRGHYIEYRNVRIKEVLPTYWVEPMKKVHERFSGKAGTFAHFGDSITVTMAFWTPLSYRAPKNMDARTKADYELVRRTLDKRCWRDWKGSRFGNTGSMTIRWAHENVDAWLKELNPEVALIMFGTNDIGRVPLKEYEAKTRAVVQKCLANGTVVILSTIPPRHAHLKQAKLYADSARKIARELKVPLCDYMAEILMRRPDDWDGRLDKFKDRKGYDVLTLVAGDGVHPSNPKEFVGDFSAAGLKTNGYTLRNYLVLRQYAHVIRKIMGPR